MLVSLNWLREFTPYEGTAQDLGDRLTMLGLELEGVIDPFAAIADIVVGHVVECGPHAESDHLSVCKVDVGESEALSIVCGAPNVAKGQKVAVAKVGTELPGGLKIKKAKLRGVPSFGMICSERELELSEDHEGIMVLPDSCKVGEKFVDAMGMEREVLDIDITPNRADCLSHLGVARETAMAFNLPLSLPEFEVVEGGEPPLGYKKIVIDDPELCPLYTGRYIAGAKIAKSPDWMRYRLLAVGQRPISNLVDVTNYVMFEMGQPLHAFDWDLLKGDVVRIAPATDGLKFTTLDGMERTLTSADLLIWDSERAIGLAGVMGGLETEMHDGSTNVFLEGASFRPGTIRKTARRLALPSEASYRLERGVDQLMTRIAVSRAAQLMADLSGAKVLAEFAVNEPIPWQDRTIRFRPERLDKLIGIQFENSFSKQVLTGLGCGVDDSDAADWTVQSPSHRLDLEREADLFEEVARVHGLDRIPEVLPRISRTGDVKPVSETAYGFNRTLKHWARGAGLREAVNYSFVGHSDLDLLGLAGEGRVPVANPLSEDQNVMRTELAPGLLMSVKNNLAQNNNRLRLFEVAKIFLADPESDTTCSEHVRLGMALYGNRFAEDWPWQGGDADYLDAKGLVEHLLDHLKLDGAMTYTVQEHSYLEPCVQVALDGEDLGVIGKVRPDIADAFHARKELWLAELDGDKLRGLSSGKVVEFRNLPKFPSSWRDVTFACPADMPAGAVLDAVKDAGVDIMESVALVAVYEPEGGDTRNLSYRITYRNPKKTLKDKDVDKGHARILKHVQDKLGVTM